MSSSVPVRRALISVSDKTGIVEFASALASRDIELVSTGGTAAALKTAGLSVKDVSDLTNFPEMMDGRVKTLHPGVHGGLLAMRDNIDHETAMREHGIAPIDLLVVNLYPFQATVARGADYETCVENIDIGGPAMIRAAAKNHDRVAVVVDPEDYDSVLSDLELEGGTTEGLRRRLAAKAYARTAAYDTAISNWFAETLKIDTPPFRTIGGRLAEELRYGENPHQWAAFYRTAENRPGVATATQLQGKALSYNNLNDTDAAFELVAEFDPTKAAAVAIIKHANPCGVAEGRSIADAYQRALMCDPTSAFGGIIAANRTIDAAAAEEITKIFTEVVIAPNITDDAREIFKAKTNLRLLITGDLPDARAPGLSARTLAGGLLVQSRDNGNIDDLDLKIVTRRAPTDAGTRRPQASRSRVAKHVKSNAIVFAKERRDRRHRRGADEPPRFLPDCGPQVGGCRRGGWPGPVPLALQGSVVASDAFFPFADGLLAAADAGATAVIQPGGSVQAMRTSSPPRTTNAVSRWS
jgi:phosphoribosylaminoimidazolecarboxamide formyltransferase/IMP cyclohydrolase